jgi:hypothetical protein
MGGCAEHMLFNHLFVAFQESSSPRHITSFYLTLAAVCHMFVLHFGQSILTIIGVARTARPGERVAGLQGCHGEKPSFQFSV